MGRKSREKRGRRQQLDRPTFRKRQVNPCCGYVTDSATIAFDGPEDVRPDVGDFCICLCCGTWLRFTAGDGRLRHAQPAEMFELEDEQLHKMRRITAHIRSPEFRREWQRRHGPDP